MSSGAVRHRPLDPWQHPDEPLPTLWGSHGGRPRTTPACCINCRAKLRPRSVRGAKIAEWPGWRVHQGRGLCTNCYQKAKKDGTLDEIGRYTSPPRKEQQTS